MINNVRYLFFLMCMMFFVCGCAEKYNLDKKMEVLCGIDGGAEVYESVVLPASDFSESGFPLDRYWGSAIKQEDKLGPDYKYFYKTEWVYGKGSDPLIGQGSLRRYTEIIYRRSDGKMLGKSIRYGRTGGDNYLILLLSDHPTNNSCPRPGSDLLHLVFKRRV